jgi:uncharacterized protein (TIGR02145 family)
MYRRILFEDLCLLWYKVNEKYKLLTLRWPYSDGSLGNLILLLGFMLIFIAFGWALLAPISFFKVYFGVPIILILFRYVLHIHKAPIIKMLAKCCLIISLFQAFATWGSYVFSDGFGLIHQFFFNLGMVGAIFGVIFIFIFSPILVLIPPYIIFKTQKPFKPEHKRGEKYDSIKIGEQEWMTGVLNESYYRNGSFVVPHDFGYGNPCNVPCWIQIKLRYDNQKWITLKEYNFPIIEDPRQIAPKGWHIPYKNEWVELFRNLGGTENSCSTSGDTISFEFDEKNEKLFNKIFTTEGNNSYLTATSSERDFYFTKFYIVKIFRERGYASARINKAESYSPHENFGCIKCIKD